MGSASASRWIDRLVLLLLLAVPALGAAQPAATQTQRIESLILSVEQLPNAKFIRNGTAYDARAAADHLRLKWREAGSRVKSAEDFIELCGSRSFVSGRPYEIRFADGKVLTSEAFLRAKLKELQAAGR